MDHLVLTAEFDKLRPKLPTAIGPDLPRHPVVRKPVNEDIDDGPRVGLVELCYAGPSGVPVNHDHVLLAIDVEKVD